MCYIMTRAYSLEQQNAGLAHTGLCHASSCNTNQVTLLTAGAWSTRQADVNDAYRRDVAYIQNVSLYAAVAVADSDDDVGDGQLSR